MDVVGSVPLIPETAESIRDELIQTIIIIRFMKWAARDSKLLEVIIM